MLVIGHLRQHVRPGHRDLDRLAGEGGDHLEFVDQAEVDVLGNAVLAGGRRVKYVGIVRGDRLGRVLPWNAGIFCQK